MDETFLFNDTCTKLLMVFFFMINWNQRFAPDFFFFLSFYFPWKSVKYVGGHAFIWL